MNVFALIIHTVYMIIHIPHRIGSFLWGNSWIFGISEVFTDLQWTVLTKGFYIEPFLLWRRWQFNLPVASMKAISIWFLLLTSWKMPLCFGVPELIYSKLRSSP